MGHYTLALIALFIPEVGENRFIVAALLALVFGPLGLFLTVRLEAGRHGVVEPFIDMVTLLVIVSFVPDIWHYALLVAVVVALAPSIAVSRRSYVLYAGNSLLLIVGMTGIALYHGVENWLVPIGILLAVFPSTLLYSMSLNQQTQEIRARAESLGALRSVAGGVAHDFNNILLSISGSTEVARSLSDNPRIQEALTRILNSTEKATQLTNQLSAFAGERPPEYQSLDLRSEVQAVAQMAASIAPAGVELDVDLPQRALFILGDPGQISQVLLNLTVNAIEAIEDEGQVCIRLFENSGAARIEVQDSGKGIPAAQQESIFEPFVSSKSRGNGLGLAVVKRVVSEHAATISIVSEVGAGTTFTLDLPLVEAPQAHNVEQPEKCILIADDEPPIRAILRHLFENNGYVVYEAEDGEQFVERFAEHINEVCAVVLDVKMPGKTGWQCLSEVRSHIRDLPVLMISGFDPEGRKVDMADPLMKFVAKPFRIAEVQATLAELIDTRTKMVSGQT